MQIGILGSYLVGQRIGGWMVSKGRILTAFQTRISCLHTYHKNVCKSGRSEVGGVRQASLRRGRTPVIAEIAAETVLQEA